MKTKDMGEIHYSKKVKIIGVLFLIFEGTKKRKGQREDRSWGSST